VASYVLTGALTQQVHMYDIHLLQKLGQAQRLMMILQDKQINLNFAYIQYCTVLKYFHSIIANHKQT